MDNHIGSGTAKGLITFLDQLVEKGRAGSGTIIPLKSSVKQILSSVDKETWNDTNVRNLDIDDYMDRFGVLTNGKYSADSLKTYRSRFTKALKWYRNFLIQPGWTPPKNGTPTKLKTTVTEEAQESDNEFIKTSSVTPVIAGSAVIVTDIQKEQNDLISYPFPLRANRIVNLYLPTDLTESEAKRLSRFIESLSIEEETNR